MSDKTDSKLELKKLSYLVRVTTFIKGNTKNDFINDCVMRSVGESQNAKQIIKLHYDLLNTIPELKGKEFCDMIKIINSRQK